MNYYYIKQTIVQYVILAHENVAPIVEFLL